MMNPSKREDRPVAQRENVVASPGARTRTSTPGALSAAAAAKRSAGSVSSHGQIRPDPGSDSEAWWIGIATRGRIRASASAAVSGSEVAGAERRAPAPDRDERDVDAALELGHLVVQVRVAREVDALRTLDQEPDRFAFAPAPEARPGMVGGDYGDFDLAYARALACRQPAHVRNPPLSDELRRRGGRQDRPAERSQRAQVQVVVMQVRDQHRIDAPERVAIGHRAASQQRPEAAAE